MSEHNDMATQECLNHAELLAIHTMQIARFGGSEGLRDEGLMRSALAQPLASFGGVLAHKDVFEMAAAYLFHLTSNHPFVDGNKRIGLAAALVFLDLCGLPIRRGTARLYALTMQVARGEVEKAAIAAELRALAQLTHASDDAEP